MRVALTNDDGIFALGIRSFYNALQARGHYVDVIAPMSEQSGVGRSITVHTPLQIKHIAEEGFSGIGVFGTPTDCVKLGLCELLPQKPEIFLSGINLGANIGPDILYSGTVSAAAEAASHGYRALAVSYNSSKPEDLQEHAHYAVGILENIPWETIPPRRVMNLNMPDRPITEVKGLKICSASKGVWKDWYHKHEDHRSRPYWWLDGRVSVEEDEMPADKHYLEDGWATLTPLHIVLTDDDLVNSIAQKMGNG